VRSSPLLLLKGLFTKCLVDEFCELLLYRVLGSSDRLAIPPGNSKDHSFEDAPFSLYSLQWAQLLGCTA
jgi:hypothetical protein